MARLAGLRRRDRWEDWSKKPFDHESALTSPHGRNWRREIRPQLQHRLRGHRPGEPEGDRPPRRRPGFRVVLRARARHALPGRAGRRGRVAPDLPIADPLECLAFVAASTTTILLGTGVLLLPFHHPVGLAKRLATIDVLSSGRMRLLTIGVGSLPGEAAAVGVDYATRGRRADEAIDVLRALWAGDAAGTSFDGEFYSFENVTSYPKPLQMLPIHVGGSSRPPPGAPQARRRVLPRRPGHPGRTARSDRTDAHDRSCRGPRPGGS